MDFEKMAEGFNVLKKEERVKTLFFAVEEDMEVKNIADRIDMSKSTVRKYLSDLKEAGLIGKKDDGYEYTTYGRKLRSSLELFAYEEEMKWLRQKEKRMKNMRDEMKAQRKKMFKQKIRNLV